MSKDQRQIPRNLQILRHAEEIGLVAKTVCVLNGFGFTSGRKICCETDSGFMRLNGKSSAISGHSGVDAAPSCTPPGRTIAPTSYRCDASAPLRAIGSLQHG